MSTQNINLLFYNFYKDIINIYIKNRPKCYIGFSKRFVSDRGGSSIINEPKIRLFPNSYYHDNRNKIHNTKSFKKIIDYIKSNKDILNSDNVIGSEGEKKIQGKRQHEVWGAKYIFGGVIYSIVQDLFEHYNAPTIIKDSIKWNFKPIELNKFNIKKNAYIERIKRNQPINPIKYFYILQNFTVDKNFTFTINSNKLSLEALSDKGKSLLINAHHQGPENISYDVATIQTVLKSDDFLDIEKIKEILALLRLYKGGNFRLYAFGELKKNIFNKEELTLNTYFKAVERPYLHKAFILFDEYKITVNEINEIRKFIKNNISKIGSFKFAVECINRLHTLDDEYKIPFLFFILESFFKNIDKELSYRLSFCIAKILEKPYDFIKIIKNLYGLRGAIVHGDTSKKLIKKINKIKNEKGEPLFNSTKECVAYLEEITRKVWKEILKNDMQNKDIEKILF